MISACDDCLRRTDLIAAMAGWLDFEWRRQDAPARVLALRNEQLLELTDRAEIRHRYAKFDPRRARSRIEAAGLGAVCRCADRYPPRLHDLADPPAVLHVAGTAECVGLDDAVAVVGARRATQYGLTVSHDIGRGLSAAGVSVVSGLALGVDAAAHGGALTAAAARGGALTAAATRGATPVGSTAPVSPPPVAVLAGGADRPYPPSKRGLYVAVRSAGAVVSEMPPGFGIHRWAFIARNRLIAALARVVVVVEATERSGSLTTADLGAELGRTIAAVPGRVTCATAAGTNGLLRDGAVLVRGVRDVLDALAELTGTGYEPATVQRQGLEPELAEMLDAIGAGHSTLPMLVSTGLNARTVLVGLGELEARGLVRRGFGGRYERTVS